MYIYIYTHNGQTCIVQYDLKISYIWCSSYVRYIVLCVYTCVYMCVNNICLMLYCIVSSLSYDILEICNLIWCNDML